MSSIWRAEYGSVRIYQDVPIDQSASIQISGDKFIVLDLDRKGD